MGERSVNKAILIGRLGSDAETRHTESGTPVSRVSLATNRQWTDSDQQVHEETDWILSLIHISSIIVLKRFGHTCSKCLAIVKTPSSITGRRPAGR